MKKILCVVLSLTMVIGLFAGTKMMISANETGPEDTTATTTTTVADGSQNDADDESTTTSEEESATDPSEGGSTTDPSEEESTTDPSEGEATTDPSTQPSNPSQEEISNWFADIITKVLAILAKICEVLFENVLW